MLDTYSTFPSLDVLTENRNVLGAGHRRDKLGRFFLAYKLGDEIQRWPYFFCHKTSGCRWYLIVATACMSDLTQVRDVRRNVIKRSRKDLQRFAEEVRAKRPLEIEVR